MDPVYKRILIKISGEALAGSAGRGHDFHVIDSICSALHECVRMGVQVAVVVGGGNIWRGEKDGQGRIERTRADTMGMLATTINALALEGSLEKMGISAQTMTAGGMGTAADCYVRDKAVRLLESGTILLLGGGTGNPFFSTDTAAVLRGAELGANIILMAKNIDGVYTADPRIDSSATKIDKVTCSEIIAKNLSVIDMTAAALASTINIPIMLFGIDDTRNICRAAMGTSTGTIITCR